MGRNKGQIPTGIFYKSIHIRSEYSVGRNNGQKSIYDDKNCFKVSLAVIIAGLRRVPHPVLIWWLPSPTGITSYLSSLNCKCIIRQCWVHILLIIYLFIIFGNTCIRSVIIFNYLSARDRFWNECPFDYTTVALSGKVKRSYTGLTTPVGCLLLLQLTVLSRSAIVVYSTFLVAFLCCHDALWIFLWV